MEYKRSVIVTRAHGYLGAVEGSTQHKQIIDAYNTYGREHGLPRGYAVQYHDAWCATFVSAIAILCEYTAIIPVECGCPQMVQIAKKMGIWQESDAYVPAPGDIVLYDWQDGGAGDDQGVPDHIGYVETVSGGQITVIEGNYDGAVRERRIAVNGRYIRGYICPRYTDAAAGADLCSVTVNMRILRQGMRGSDVYLVQQIIGAKADGYFGPKTGDKVADWQRTHKECGPVDKVIKRKTWTSLLSSLGG